jgi:DNA polymerase III alpha subunit (gram-positive type)
MIDMIFDTETTGFVQWKLPEDHPEQTQLMELGIIIAKGDEVLLEWNQLVYCTQEPSEGAFNAHKISREMCQEAGVSLRHAVETFNLRLHDVDRVVAHNFNFDRKIMLCAIAQANAMLRSENDSREPISPSYFLSKPNVCTMLTATNIVQVPHPKRGGWKWPTLNEAYQGLVDPDGFENAHRAIHDANATLKVLRKLEGMNAEFRSAS